VTLLDAALAWHHAGCSVIPVRTDGTKMPAVTWKAYQDQPASEAVVTEWFTSGRYDGIGIICGAVSGHLEMFEAEGRAVTDTLPAFRDAMRDNGHGDLWDRLNSGFLEQSPSGGLHWLYRVAGEARRNLKLARRPATSAELEQDPADKVKVLLETRGEGGYVVVAPSAGRTHSTGGAWTFLVGTPATIPTLTVDERDALHAIASMFDTMPAAEPIQPAMSFGGSTGGTRPGDDFNQRAVWEDILTGWTKVKHFGGNCYGWVRPGKNTRDGISATTGRNDGDNLYVFSSSTELDTERPYSKFSVYTMLEHNGDYSAAAKQLRADGYGTPPPEQPRPAAAVAASEQVHHDEDPPVQLTYSATEDGNALRLIDAHGEQLRYCPQRGSWLRWDGHRWRWDQAGHVNELARAIARSLPADDKPSTVHRQKSLSSNGLTSMIRIARTDPRIVVDLGQLDGQPYELNTPAGVVDLRTGKLRDPDPAALHTRSTSVAPDFDTIPTRWLQFLSETFAGDPALTTYVQRLLGLSLIGEALEAILPFGWGSGANGKSTLFNVAQDVAGKGDEGYSISAPAELLLSTTHRGHPTEIARLSGARLVVASELEAGERFAEARIKLLTGKDTLSGRFMGKDFFNFTPTHTIWLHANDKPDVRTGGPAFWRRLKVLDFVHVVPPAERINGLDEILVKAEGPAILAWIIAGAVQYLSDGLAEPDSVRTSTGAYEHDQDAIARFVEECCEVGDANAQHMNVRVAEVRTAYENWCHIEGEETVTAKALTTALKTRYGVQSNRTMSARFYAGIRLLDPSSDASSESGQDGLDSGKGGDDWWQR
jgi:putative DNA primase/helicase